MIKSDISSAAFTPFIAFFWFSFLIDKFLKSELSAAGHLLAHKLWRMNAHMISE
jgi:hypothetical protein